MYRAITEKTIVEIAKRVYKEMQNGGTNSNTNSSNSSNTQNNQNNTGANNANN